MREQSAPKIIVFLRHNPEKQSLIYIVVKNVGNDLAQSLQFTPSRPIPANAFGFDEKRKTKEVMTTGPLVTGVPSLGPGEERVVLWGQYGGIVAALSDGPVLLQYSYRQGSRTFTGEADLEVASLANTDASAAPIVDVVKHLDSISKSVQQIASNTEPPPPRDTDEG
jgi:hypothetical protein